MTAENAFAVETEADNLMTLRAMRWRCIPTFLSIPASLMLSVELKRCETPGLQALDVRQLLRGSRQILGYSPLPWE